MFRVIIGNCPQRGLVKTLGRTRRNPSAQKYVNSLEKKVPDRYPVQGEKERGYVNRRSIRWMSVALAAPLATAVVSDQAPAFAAQPAAHTRPAATSPVAAQAGWKVKWKATIPAKYFNKHNKIWWSQPFTVRTVKGRFRCWNNGDGGRIRLQIVNYRTGKVVRQRTAVCNDWYKWHSTRTLHYKKRTKVRFRVEALGKAHTTRVQARVPR